jgi:organic radical activating enzyme
MNNLCNMACVMCGSHNSTLHHALEISHQGHAEFPRSDPQLVDECVHQITQHRSTIQHLSFAGGEPMVMPGVLRIIKMLCESGDASHIAVRFTTNGTVWRSQWEQWLDQFQAVHVDVSVDAVGEMAHRVRPPTQWPAIEHNILAMQAWCQRSTQRHIMLACTVHALNLTALHDLYQWHTDHGIRAWYDRVQTPLWLRPRQAPTNIKQHCADWISVMPDDDFRSNMLPELALPREDTAEITAQQHQGCDYLAHVWRAPWHEVMPQLAHWPRQP